LFIITTILPSCQTIQNAKEPKTYPRHVGDIAFDPKLDSKEFKPCHEDLVAQYYNFGIPIQYKGEKPALERAFYENYSIKKIESENGYVTVRFVVNCEGRTGRFRVEELDNDYTIKTFDEQITKQLLAITKSLDGWEIKEYEYKKYDYYQYLTFKIENAQIIDILP